MTRIPERIALSHVAYLAGNTSSIPFAFTPQAIGEYLRLILFPFQLTLYHATPDSSVNTIIFSIFVILLVISFLKKKTITFWLLLLVMSLSVTLVSAHISWVVAERYAYIGTAGLIPAIVLFYFYITKKFPRYHTIFFLLPIAVISIFSIRTIVRNRDWKNEEMLWKATIAVSPNDFGVHNDLGMIYMQQSRFDEAIQEFSTSILLNPKFPTAFYNRGYAYMRMGNSDAAIHDFQAAILLDPQLTSAYQNIGALYYRMRNYGQAMRYAQKALMLSPENSVLYSNLAVIYVETMQYEKAKQILEKALQINPRDTSALQGLRIIQSKQSSINSE